MKKFFKYLFLLLAILFCIIYYLFNTSNGNNYLNGYLSNYLSSKSKNKITINDIKFGDYPKIGIDMKVNQNNMDIIGEVVYSDGFRVKGVTSEFGGKLYFNYNIYKKEILFVLEKVSLENILKKFSYPVRMRANLFGTIRYDIKSKLVTFDNRLKNVHLIENRVTHMIFVATNIDMTKYIYDKSSFVGHYYDSLLSGDFKIDSGKEHIYFKNLLFYSKTKKIDSYFDFKMEGQELSGKVKGTTLHPRLTIDFSKLIKHQFHKQIRDVDDEVNEFSKKAKSIFNIFF